MYFIPQLIGMQGLVLYTCTTSGVFFFIRNRLEEIKSILLELLLYHLLKNTNMNKTLKKKVNFVDSSQNEGLLPSCIALSFDGSDLISWHNIYFFSPFTVLHFFFRMSNVFSLHNTEETEVIEMCIWCIKIGIVLHLRSPFSKFYGR
jgi:hypothetical protein